MASAYATFAQRGQRVKPTTVKQVFNSSGALQYEHRVVPEQVIASSVADAVNGVLEEVVRSGTATGAQQIGRPVAGKTGTSNENKSMWFVGYTPQLSTAVLMAREDAEGNPQSLDGLGGGAPSWGGGGYPVAIWAAFTAAALANDPVESFVVTTPLPSGTPMISPSAEDTATATPTPIITPTITPTPSPTQLLPTTPPPTSPPNPTGPVTPAPLQPPLPDIIGDPQ
jgi:membrane peptidoglycan carboxypeptidase